jgi:predicted metal-dependent hydrolase
MQLDWTQGALAEGLRRYEAGEFFAAHEEWESVWLRSPEPEKTFLQALIQVAAAFHHLRRNNPQGTVQLLQAALRRLELYPEQFGGVSVGPLRQQIRERLQALDTEGPAPQLSPPNIRS